MGFSCSCCQAAAGAKTVLKAFSFTESWRASEESLRWGLIPGPPWVPDSGQPMQEASTQLGTALPGIRGCNPRLG